MPDYPKGTPLVHRRQELAAALRARDALTAYFYRFSTPRNLLPEIRTAVEFFAKRTAQLEAILAERDPSFDAEKGKTKKGA